MPTILSQPVTTDENTPVAIMLTGSDRNGDALTYSVVVQSSNGVFSGALPNLTCTPNKNFISNDNFTFKANDGLDDSNAGEITILVESTTVNILDDDLSIIQTNMDQSN